MQSTHQDVNSRYTITSRCICWMHFWCRWVENRCSVVTNTQRWDVHRYETVSSHKDIPFASNLFARLFHSNTSIHIVNAHLFDEWIVNSPTSSMPTPHRSAVYIRRQYILKNSFSFIWRIGNMTLDGRMRLNLKMPFVSLPSTYFRFSPFKLFEHPMRAKDTIAFTYRSAQSYEHAQCTHNPRCRYKTIN